MKHIMKVMLALALSALLALSMLALAEDVTAEVEALDGEIAAENVDATPGETDAALSEEIEAALTPDAEVEVPEETSDEVQVEEDAEEEEETVEETSSEEEESSDEEATEEESSDEEASEDAPVVEDAETPAEAETADAEMLMELLTDEEAVAAPSAVEGLVYTGEPQALVTGPTDGTVLYSLDGENYSPDIPTGVNAGEYTVFYKMTAPAEPAQEATEDAGEEADEAVAEEEAQEAVQNAEAETVAPLTVTIAKADVVFTPPVAAFGE